MTGLEISHAYYEEHGREMIERDFPAERIAVGLAGEGSECLGYDDEISRDHDFEPGFCLWVTDEDYRDFGFRLERAYSKLPREYMGLRRSLMSPVGGNRRGVLVIGDFFDKFIGGRDLPASLQHWMSIPSPSLRAAVSGQVFRDDLGELSRIRNELLRGYPEDVRRKKLSAHAAMMAQSGQYNFGRCIARGEQGAAQLAVYEFVRHALSTVYLLNNVYEPFYKWVYRGMRELEILGDLADSLWMLTETDNRPSNARLKGEAMEDICGMLIEAYRAQGLTEAVCADMEKHAVSMADGITDAELRNTHLMYGV